MKMIARALIASCLLLGGHALAQSNPSWYYGFQPTPAQWNAMWSSKQDVLGNGTALPITSGGTGGTSFGTGPVLANGLGPFTTGVPTGNTTTYATAIGTLTNGHCVQFDSHGNLIDAGGACSIGGGGGTVSSSIAGQIAYYLSSGTTVVGATTGAGVISAMSNAVNAPSGLLALNATGQATIAPSSGTSQINMYGKTSNDAAQVNFGYASTQRWALGGEFGGPNPNDFYLYDLIAGAYAIQVTPTTESVVLDSTTPSTSTGTGALTVHGGIGALGAIYGASFNGSGSGLTGVPVASLTGLGANVGTALTTAANAAGGIPLAAGGYTVGHCLQWGSGGVTDAGGACGTGSGSGTVSSGTSGQLAYYTGTGTVVGGTTTGTGVLTALSNNTGSAGSFLVNGGALGTPSSGTLTNATGLPISGISGLGSGVATALGNTAGAAGGFATYSSLGSGAFASAYSLPAATSSTLGGVKPDGTTITNSSGAISVTYGASSNTAAQGNDARIVGAVQNGGALGTPSSGTLTNVSGLPISTGVSGLGSGVANALGFALNNNNGVVGYSGALGTPSSGNLANTTGYAVSNLSGAGSGVLAALGVSVSGSGNIVLTSALSAVLPSATTSQIYGGSGSAGVASVISSLPATFSTFTQTGTGAVATNLGQMQSVRPLYATDFMTSSQIADGLSRTDSIDVSAAINSCIVAGISQGRSCYLASGTWKASGAQIVVDQNPNLYNGIMLWGDTAGTILDMQANSANPPILYEGSSGTPGSPVSVVYGGMAGMHILCNVAGPCIQDGRPNFGDYMNQQLFFNVVVQNFNTGSSSICFQFNAVYSPAGLHLNCSSGAGTQGGNNLFQFRKVAFGNWQLGGSNGQVFLGFSTDYNYGNVFNATDCEVVQNCITASSGTIINNTFIGGTWSWNWGSNGQNAISMSVGSDNYFINPNQNASAGTGSAGPFLASVSAGHAYMGGLGAYLQTTPGNPSPTTSTSGVMMGLGATCTFTPKTTGRMLLFLNGNFYNSTANFSTAQAYYGSGAAPSNGAAPTGTGFGTVSAEQGTNEVPFSNGGVVTGLSNGVTYWVDERLTATGGTATLNNFNCSAIEF